MAGRYVFTPARRAALKRAAAKSAAKRRRNGANRKAYKSAKRSVQAKENAAFRRATTKKGRQAAQRRYDRGIADAKTKHLGKKQRSDKYLKNRRRAIGVAVNGAAIAVAIAPTAIQVHQGRKNMIKQQFGNKENYKLHRDAFKKERKQDKIRAKNTGPKARKKATKAARKSYNRAQTNINRADRRDERRSGIKRNATGKRKVKSSRVYGPGNVMVSQKALTSGRR